MRIASRRTGFVLRLLLGAAFAVGCRRSGSQARHPLDPLTTGEIGRVRAVLDQRGLVGGEKRVSSVDLLEPSKADVLNGIIAPRKAIVVLYDAARNETSEAIVDVDARTLESNRDVPGVEPPLDAVDADVAESVTRASDAWRQALAKRGLVPSDVNVSAWSAGNFGAEDPSRGRLVRAVASVRAASANEMSRPIEGLVALVDVAARKVLEIQDAGPVAVPTQASERDAWQPLPRATTPSPPAGRETEDASPGVSVEVDGHAVSWRRWRFHAAIRPREGLVLYGVGFDDGTAVRSVLYRASLSEMVVPYGDPSDAWYFRNSFDVGELGVGVAVSSLTPGIDCPRGSRFLDATFAEPSGAARRVPRAIALYERDGGIAWKHANSGARAAELVVLSVSRLGNYDYGFEWTFHEDGTISHRVLLTGVMAPKGAIAANDSVAHTVATGVSAVNHQHFFNYRLDFDIDGATSNRVERVETRPLSAAANAHGGGFAVHATDLSNELDALDRTASGAAEGWLIVNSARRNRFGQPTGYELVPGGVVASLADSSSAIRHRAGFLDAPLWVTPYIDSERWSAGTYPNQSRGGEGLTSWTRANRSVRDADVVVWYIVGVTHNPRPEDWPVMPVQTAGFTLVPVGFFDRNPTLGSP